MASSPESLSSNRCVTLTIKFNSLDERNGLSPIYQIIAFSEFIITKRNQYKCQNKKSLTDQSLKEIIFLNLKWIFFFVFLN